MPVGLTRVASARREKARFRVPVHEFRASRVIPVDGVV
jgi:hypothetical protein